MTLRTDVAALYVDRLGPYPKLVAEWFDEARDARTYAGPLPVVAHPPCGPWGNLYKFCKHQDADLGPLAVTQVQRWGGVLEHPAGSKLWRHCQLPYPEELRDQFGGYTAIVNQVDWGHVAQKKTWLYIVGYAVGDLYHSLPLEIRHPTHVVSRSRKKGPALPEMRKSQRHITPPLFASWLLDLAAQAGKARAT